MTLEFEEDKVNLFFDVDAEDAVAYTMTIYAKDKSNNGSKKKVYTSERFLLAGKYNHYWIIMDYIFYNKVAKLIATSGKPLPNKIEFFFEVEAELQCNDECTIEKEELDDTLTLHFVRYLPKLMNVLGFSNGEKLMRTWFMMGKNESIEKVDPKLNFVDWTWLMNESAEFKEEYVEFKENIIEELKAVFSNDSKNILRSEINKMITEGLITKPTQNNLKVNFGVSSNKLIPYANKLYPDREIMPKFEKYYFKYKSFEGKFDVLKHYAREGGVDDFIAAIATFNYRVYASGNLEYKEGGYFSSESTLINITQLSFYLKDRYDFADEDPNNSQFLGYWEIKSKSKIDVSLVNITSKNYYKITNKFFREYREEHKNEGYDYHLYSTINNIKTDISLKL